MQNERGALGRYDVREMVLELTMQLTEAEKGILLSGRDSDSGRLGVVCSLGFENDPEDSAIAKRFARLAVLISGADLQTAEEVARELAEALDQGLAEATVGATAWRPDEDGEQVITRAKRLASRTPAAAS